MVTSSDSGSSTRKGSDSSINGRNGIQLLFSGDDSFDPLRAFSTKSLRVASKGEEDKKSSVSKHDQPALIAESVSQQGNRPSATGRTGAELLKVDGTNSYEEDRARAQTSWVPSAGFGDGTPARTTIRLRSSSNTVVSGTAPEDDTAVYAVPPTDQSTIKARYRGETVQSTIERQYGGETASTTHANNLFFRLLPAENIVEIPSVVGKGYSDPVEAHISVIRNHRPMVLLGRAEKPLSIVGTLQRSTEFIKPGRGRMKLSLS